MKKKVGEKSCDQKCEDFLEIPVCICGEKDSGGGMGNTCKRRRVLVHMGVVFD